jgi:chromate transporter
VALAYGAGALGGQIGEGVLHGLKLVAVAIVAQAVWDMARRLCADPQRASIAAVAALLALLSSSLVTPMIAILLGGISGVCFCRYPASVSRGSLNVPVSRGIGVISLLIFILLLVGLPLIRGVGSPQGMALFEAFYRSGALVFGGGHVVLPLLRDAVVAPGWVTDNAFLAGYGAAQAIPGPLFTVAAYLGAVAMPLHGIAGAALGLVGIFLPGMLVLVGTLPFWDAFRSSTGAQAAMRGVNAAVVGLLGAALYTPVWTSTVRNATDLGVAVIGFVLLTAWRAPPIVVVSMGILAGILLSIFMPLA